MNCNGGSRGGAEKTGAAENGNFVPGSVLLPSGAPCDPQLLSLVDEHGWGDTEFLAMYGFTSVRCGGGAVRIIPVQFIRGAGPGGGHFQYHPSAALTRGAAMDERPNPPGAADPDTDHEIT